MRSFSAITFFLLVALLMQYTSARAVVSSKSTTFESDLGSSERTDNVEWDSTGTESGESDNVASSENVQSAEMWEMDTSVESSTRNIENDDISGMKVYRLKISEDENLDNSSEEKKESAEVKPVDYEPETVVADSNYDDVDLGDVHVWEEGEVLFLNSSEYITIEVIEESSKVDVVWELQSWKDKEKPTEEVWEYDVSKFCKRFPQHPDCSEESLPEFDRLDNMLTLIEEGYTDFLPEVPVIDIVDPLRGIDQDLVDVIEEYVIRFEDEDEIVVEEIRENCAKEDCISQPKVAVSTKRLLEAKMFELDNAFTEDEEQMSDNIQLGFDRTQQLKVALIEKSNLSGVVVPPDNGLFQSDLLLTVDQADYMLNELGKAGMKKNEIPPPPTKTNSAKKVQGHEESDIRKRSAYFLEENLVQKWDVRKPIMYWFSEALDYYQRSEVKWALTHLEQNTCIRFQEATTMPKTHHIQYHSMPIPGLCGLSNLGRMETFNSIGLNFGCPIGVQMRGVALHETLHALGVAHQQLRFDRDQHIKVDFGNVHHLYFDQFKVVDSKLFTSYGVKYDYGSIMHYPPNFGAKNTKKLTMRPLYDFEHNLRKMGQRKALSESDIELLKKMYCTPGCKDNNVYCGAWALKGLCKGRNSGYVAPNCRKSCNLCG